MNNSHKLMALGLAFGLLGSTGAFARPTPHFENECLPCEKKMVPNHFPRAETSGATRYAHRPAVNADRDGWPANMLLN
jgi:hypothetical protein